MARTRSACPACKQSGEWRASDDICKPCRRIYDEGLLRRREVSEMPKTILALLPSRASDLPYIPHTTHFNPGGDTPGANVQNAFYALLKLVTTPAPHEQTTFRDALMDGQKSGLDFKHRIRINKEIARVLNDLHKSFVTATEEAYQKGREDGGNMLVRIAEGDLSIAEINKATIDAR